MGSKVVFCAKAFGKDRKGDLVAAKSVTCRSAAAAMQEAERQSHARGAVGAVALQGQNDDDFGMTEEPVVLVSFGEVPGELRDAVPF